MGTFAIPSIPLSAVVPVSVIVTPVAPATPSFNQALVCGSSAVIPSVGANSRVRLYSSTSQMLTDGFMNSEPEFLAASNYFATGGQQLWVGRQDLSAIASATVGSSGGTGYVVGDILTVVQSSASAGLVKVTTVSSGVVTGLSIIQGSQGTGYSVANNLATTGGTGSGCEVDITAVGETPLQAMTACRLATPLWYIGIFVGTAQDSDHSAIAAFLEGAQPPSQYWLSTSEAAVLAGTTPNVLATLQAAGYRRTYSAYATTQSGSFPNNAYAAAFPVGYAMGANNGTPGSYFSLGYKQFPGWAPELLTESQTFAIAGNVGRQSPGLNGNVYVNFQNGTSQNMLWSVSAGGYNFNEVLFMDMLAADIQNSCYFVLRSLPNVPMTDAGVNMMKTVTSQACQRSQAIGFVAPSGTWNGQQIGTGTAALVPGQALPQGFYIFANPISTISAANKQNGILPALTVALIQSGTAKSLAITVYPQ